MVKPDVKHNYYADLELPTNASIEDVRKAYRKLALQYHPDRNSGREEECVPKFQAIQQANEVLGDAAIKQKYDIDRRKAGLYPSTQPTGFTPRQPTPGSNPYSAASAYPPPPRRTQPGTWQQRPPPAAASAAANAGGATGADRFSNFPRPSHPTAKKDHAQERTNMFNAWQNMSTPQNRQPRFNPQPNPQQPPPQPQSQPQPQTARPRPQPPQPPPRQQPNTMPTEEQIRAGTKYRQPPPPAPGLDGLNERQKAWQAFEQNGPNKPGINRSNTTRTPKRQGFNPNTPGSDERAAPATGGGYVHRNKSADFGRPRQFPPPPPGAPPAGQMPTSPISPNVSPTSARPGTDPTRPDRTQVPFAEANRNRTPYTSFIGEKTDFGGENMRRSFSTRDTTKLDPGDAANRNRARSSSPPRRESTANGGKAPFAIYSSSSASSSASDMAQTPGDHDSTTEKQRSADQRPKRVPRAPSSRVGNGASSNPASPMPPDSMSAEGMQQKSKPNIFTFPNADHLFTSSTHKSRSEEQINTKFSPEGWSGTFTGEPDYFPPSKSRSPSRRPVSSRTASSQRRAATMDLPNNSPNPETMQRPWGSDGQPKDASASGFSTADWQNKFQDPSWTMPPPPPNPPSPSKLGASAPGSRRPSRTLRAKKGQTFQSHVDGVTVEVEDDDGKHDSGVPNADDFDAMDIDNTPPAQRKPDVPQDTSAQAAEKEARLYSVPPSAWRQQQEQAQAQQPNRHRKNSSASRRAQRASASSATGAKLNTNLDDLRNVEPIARTAGPAVGGGFNMASMSDDLPFQSASAKSIPVETLQKLDVPTVPTTPELPRRWSKLSWHMYSEHFADYLKRQHDFNKKMLSYFAVRLQSDEQLISTGSKAWLEASGVTQNGIGFDAYAQDVRKDEEMRATWDIGCERHRKAVKEFGESRERVKGLAQSGSLPE